MLLAVILGLIAGFFLIPFFHEVGHYTIACAYNCTNIDKFVYAPQNAVTSFVPNITQAAFGVSYKEPIPAVYGSYGILVYLGGFIFEMATFAIIVLLLRKYNKPVKDKEAYKFAFLVGFFANFIGSVFSWIYDFYNIFLRYFQWNENTITIAVYAILIAIYLVWFFFFQRYYRLLARIIKSK